MFKRIKKKQNSLHFYSDFEVHSFTFVPQHPSGSLERERERERD